MKILNTTEKAKDSRLIDWLMQGDPSIRWQVMRDLMQVPERKWIREQAQVAKTGWGLRLLSHQQKDGQWGNGLYSPKWTSTHYTLLLLKTLGLPPGHQAALKGCKLLMDGAFQPRTGGMWDETCISGMALSLFCFFRLEDDRIGKLLQYLLREQMADGGWNCRRARGAVHSSFHTTINVLEGLREYAKTEGASSDIVRTAEKKGREFLMEHKMICSSRTGRIIASGYNKLSFPCRWYHDNLRGLDYFQDSGAEHDERLADAIDRLNKKRRKDGTWPLQNKHPGKVFFDMEQAGKPSRWNTLRALRVLQWWEK
jgi:hypothetical protein